MSILDYGWNEHFSDSFAALGDPALEPGRVLLASAGSYRLMTRQGECRASLAGRLRHSAVTRAELPVVGDWVAIRPFDATEARIERMLPRRTRLSRKVPGTRSDEQVFAANVDAVFAVMGLDGDFNLRRLERILVTIWESGARPVVVLNKRDLCDDPAARLAEVQRVATGLPLVLSSCVEADGIDAIRAQIVPRETVALLGSSGVGKSSLINRLAGTAVQKTGDVREDDDRGRHTTTHRELFGLADGGLLIDSPGLREVQLWSGGESLSRAFADLVVLAETCRFRDCSHRSEAGCAVLEAVERGELPGSRLESFRKLQKELEYLELRQNESAQRVQKKKWRAIHREKRRNGRHRRH